jgi:galactose-1-phosphate uridylyltransferase
VVIEHDKNQKIKRYKRVESFMHRTVVSRVFWIEKCLDEDGTLSHHPHIPATVLQIANRKSGDGL